MAKQSIGVLELETAKRQTCYSTTPAPKTRCVLVLTRITDDDFIHVYKKTDHCVSCLIKSVLQVEQKEKVSLAVAPMCAETAQWSNFVDGKKKIECLIFFLPLSKVVCSFGEDDTKFNQ